MITRSARRCPVCDASESEVLHRQSFIVPDGHPLPDGYEVVCCIRCGFGYADSIVTQSEYDRYYADHSKYEDEGTSTGGGGTTWDADRLRETAADLALHLGRDARVLDVGCANGGLLSALRDEGFTELTGVDPSPMCVRHTQQLGIPAQEGSLFALPTSLGQFDVVLLSHVLEHVHDLSAAVERVLEALEPIGSVYVEVPDAMRYAELLVAPFQDFNTEHINHFSWLSLANLMARHGLTAIAQGHKTLQAPPPIPYPAVFGLFCRDSRGPAQLGRDDSLCESLKSYVRKSHTMMLQMDARLREVLARSPEVVVWGTGQLAMKLLIETELADANVVAFVDGNPVNQGLTLRGSPILAPDHARRFEVPIVIASTIHQEAIARTVRHELGMSNELVLLRD